MSEFKDDYQQQILFEEAEIPKTNDDQLLEKQQIVFNNNDWQATDELLQASEEITFEKSKPRWIWRAIFSLFTVILVIESVEFFTSGFNQSPIITSIYAALLLCVSLLAGTSLFRELSGLRMYRKQQDIQNQAMAILADEEGDNAQALCEKITAQLPCDLQSKSDQQWDDILSENYNDTELLQLYSRVVLSKVDQKAIAEIAKYSSESVVLIALSPVAILDMLIMLWRNLKMIDKIAGLYGLKLGYWSRVRLIKQVFVNMVYAGASELVADFGADMLGADVLGKLSGRLAQGLGAGLLTARLGLKTLKLCRPIPFENDAPKLGAIRREMISQLKKLTNKK